MKLWMSRDLNGDKNIFIWNEKPQWDQETCTYGCKCKQCDLSPQTCKAIIAVLTPDCPDFNSILKFITQKTNQPIKQGEMIELTTGIKTSMGISLSQKAQELAKRLKSEKKPTNKELVSFLSSIVQDDEPQNEGEGNGIGSGDENAFSMKTFFP